MNGTARFKVSTLGVILGACLCPLTALAQATSGAPPTAGFADPTPDEQRRLTGDAKVGGGSSAASFAAPAPASLAPRAYASAAPTRAPARPAYDYAAAPRYTYTAPAQYAYQGPSGGAAGYRYGATSTGDVRTDDSGGGASKDKSKKAEHFRLGILGGVGFPRPLALEGMIKLERVLGLGIEYSTTPTLSISGTDTSFWALAATLRVFPFKDGFFLGVRAGRQHLGGEGTVTVAPYGSFRESVTVDTTFLNPRLGFLWTWDSGVSLGIDGGVQVPIGVTVASTLPRGTGVDQEVMDVANAIGNSPLPTIDLLKVGFLL